MWPFILAPEYIKRRNQTSKGLLETSVWVSKWVGGLVRFFYISDSRPKAANTGHVCILTEGP